VICRQTACRANVSVASFAHRAGQKNGGGGGGGGAVERAKARRRRRRRRENVASLRGGKRRGLLPPPRVSCTADLTTRDRGGHAHRILHGAHSH